MAASTAVAGTQHWVLELLQGQSLVDLLRHGLLIVALLAAVLTRLHVHRALDKRKRDGVAGFSAQELEDAGVPTVARISVYPIKGCAGVDMKRVRVTPTGLLCDHK